MHIYDNLNLQRRAQKCKEVERSWQAGIDRWEAPQTGWPARPCDLVMRARLIISTYLMMHIKVGTDRAHTEHKERVEDGC